MHRDPDQDAEGPGGSAPRWSDATTPFSTMRGDVARFIEARDWGRYHHPVNVASAMVVEAGELLELFQWRRPGDDVPTEVATAAGSELADVLHFALCLANALETPLDWDTFTVKDLLEGEEGPTGGAKGAAEEVLTNASLALMAARARYGPGGSGEDGGADTGLDALMVAVEMTMVSLNKCARALGLDLARELELKNRLNEDRFPVGTRPDVGY